MADAPAPYPPPPDALLFDLGGVLIDIDFDRIFQRWAADSGIDVDEIRARWSMDEPYQRHERAEIDAEEYFASLRHSIGVELPAEQLVAGWNEVFVGLIPGVVELLDELAEQLPLYVLTNTNPTHAAHWTAHYGPHLEAVSRHFISSEIGLRKPDAAAFAHVAAEIGVPIDRIHFFDDTESNVVGARAAGMPATLVTSFDQLAEVARELVRRR